MGQQPLGKRTFMVSRTLVGVPITFYPLAFGASAPWYLWQILVFPVIGVALGYGTARLAFQQWQKQNPEWPGSFQLLREANLRNICSGYGFIVFIEILTAFADLALDKPQSVRHGLVFLGLLILGTYISWFAMNYLSRSQYAVESCASAESHR